MGSEREEVFLGDSHHPMTFLAPLILGFAGSLHCIGMCGPLVLALPLANAERWQVLRQMAVYHSGRILTYTALGILFGLLGKGMAVAGFQQVLSIGAGALMISMALVTWRFESLVTSIPGFGQFTRKIQSRIGKLMRAHPGRATFSMGLLNGLLPCGMVYAALAGAISAAGTLEGALFMAIFGLGTLPLLLAVSVLGRSFNMAVRKKIRLAQPVLLTIAGLLLIQRGLHLDLSLFESAVPKAGVDCH
jgi:sulfite exporter TauE/SafE